SASGAARQAAGTGRFTPAGVRRGASGGGGDDGERRQGKEKAASANHGTHLEEGHVAGILRRRAALGQRAEGGDARPALGPRGTRSGSSPRSCAGDPRPRSDRPRSPPPPDPGSR